jgi:hypothetical protein
MIGWGVVIIKTGEGEGMLRETLVLQNAEKPDSSIDLFILQV